MDVPAHIQRTFAYDRLFRSQLLYHAIALEGVVDEIIAWHFCPDPAKHGLFFASLFREGEIGFAKKIRILRRLFRASYPDLDEPFRFLLKRLEILRELRNKFAHSRLVLPDEAPPAEEADGVRLRYLKANGEEAEELVARSAVDQQVKEHANILMVGLWLRVIIEGRATGSADPKKEADLVDFVRWLKQRIEQPPDCGPTRG
jgi:hypothetical protein